MKKLLLLFTACLLVFSGCKKDEERTEQTILVHLMSNDGKLITLKPENTAVFFFEDNGKAIDYTKSKSSIDDGKLTYTDGSMSSKVKIMDIGKAVYTFENVPNGKYILWTHYFPYSVGVHSSKQLTVTESSHMTIEKKIFKDNSGYEEW